MAEMIVAVQFPFFHGYLLTQDFLSNEIIILMSHTLYESFDIANIKKQKFTVGCNSWWNIKLIINIIIIINESQIQKLLLALLDFAYVKKAKLDSIYSKIHYGRKHHIFYVKEFHKQYDLFVIFLEISMKYNVHFWRRNINIL